jgi:plastocyanin
MRRLTSLWTVIALLHNVTFNLAQSTTTSSTTYYTSASSSSSSSAAATFTVRVGDGSNTFVPDVVQANPGDIIEFDFYPQNHSVARAEYLKPCIPYEDTGVGKVGFFSGFHPVDAILNSPPKWRVRVNDSNPVFYYCTAPGSCINYQMVGVINPVCGSVVYLLGEGKLLTVN